MRCKFQGIGYNGRMSNDTRWMALLTILGLCTAYVLWGQRSPANPADSGEKGTVPTVTLPAATTVAAQSTGNATPDLQAAKHGATNLKFNPDLIDFGAVPVGEIRTAEISVENPTEKPIKIKDLVGSCGCLTIDAEKTEIAPHQSIPIHVHFTATPGRKVDHVRGIFISNETDTPQISFDVRALVKEEFILDGAPIKFSSMKKDATKTQDATIRSDDGKPFAIKSITGENADFAYAWDPVADKHGSAYTIHATLKSGKGGIDIDTATIQTGRAEKGSVQFQSSGTIEPDVDCTPAIIVAEMDSKRNVEAFTTVMKRSTAGRLEILSITHGAKHPIPLDTVVDRLDEQTCRLTIKFKEPYPEYAPYGHMSIKTNVEEKEFVLPYRINSNTALAPGQKKAK
jgi:hypothetical protein